MQTNIAAERVVNAAPYTIYGLTDPREADDIKRVRYVGKGPPLIRYWNHIRCARREGRIHCTSGVRHTHCCNWLRSLLTAGLLPGQRILEWTILGDGGEREQAWIRSLRDQGADLTNLTDGGEGTPGHKHSPESIAKMSAAKRANKAWLGRHHSEGAKLKISKAGVGNKRRLGCHASKKTCARMSAAQMGNKNSLGNKNCLGKKNALGYHHSEGAKLKMSAARMGNKNSLGHHASEETKLKMSIARRAYWAARKAGLSP